MKNSFDWRVIKGDHTVINHFIHHQTYCAHIEKYLEKKVCRALQGSSSQSGYMFHVMEPGNESEVEK